MDFPAELANFPHRMKNDTTTTVLNFVLAVLVILGVAFALMSMTRQRELRQRQIVLQIGVQQAQIVNMRAQALANEVLTYNNTAKSAELNKILQSVLGQPAPAK